MKLAEALIERKSLKERIGSLRVRLTDNALVQEGDRPAEAPAELLAAMREAIERLRALIRSINATNMSTEVEDRQTLADAIVERDMVKLERDMLDQLAGAASIRQHRFGQNEVKFVAVVDPSALRAEVDALSKQWRMLDARIQAANWATELHEVE